MIRLHHAACLLALCALPAAMPAQAAPAADAPFSIPEILDYPYASELAAAERVDRIAWVRNVGGVRNVWVADGPGFTPRQVTQLPRRRRAGNHAAHLLARRHAPRLCARRRSRCQLAGGRQPRARSRPPSPEQPQTTIWAVALTARRAGESRRRRRAGDFGTRQLAYIKDHQVWTAPLDGKGKPERLFFDRGKDARSRWSPDGTRLAFVSDRGDQRSSASSPRRTNRCSICRPRRISDMSPRWSPDGARIAFVRRPGDGGPPQPILTQTPASLVDLGGRRRERHRAISCGKAPTRLRVRFPTSKARRICTGRRATGWCFSPISTTGRISIRLPAAGGQPLAAHARRVHGRARRREPRRHAS